MLTYFLLFHAIPFPRFVVAPPPPSRPKARQVYQKSESPATSKASEVAQKLAQSIKKVHGIDAKCIGIGGGTVAAELRREGIDAAVWSTLDDQAHQPNEYCKVENLLADAMTLVEMFR